jgi:autotransporter translocation and assembly factor TamB
MIKYFSISKYILRILYIFLALISISAIGISWFFSNSGKIYLQSLIHKQLSSVIGYQIEAKDISFNFPMTLHLTKISLADTQGKWIEANNLSFGISIIPMIRKHFIIYDISADQINLLRTPKKISTTTKENKQNIKVSALIKDIKEIIIPTAVTNTNKDIVSSLRGLVKWTSLDNRLTFKSNASINNIAQNLKSLEVNASGAYEGKTEDINIDFIQILNNVSKIHGNAKLNLKLDSIFVDAKLKNLIIGEWLENSAGNADIEVKVNGTIKAPIINVIGKLHSLRYKKKNIPDFIINLNGLLNKGNWVGDINIDSPDISNMNLSYIKSTQKLELNNINANYLENYVKGNLHLNLNTMFIDGKLDAKFLAIEQFSLYLPEAVKGRVDI